MELRQNLAYLIDTRVYIVSKQTLDLVARERAFSALKRIKIERRTEQGSKRLARSRRDQMTVPDRGKTMDVFVHRARVAIPRQTFVTFQHIVHAIGDGGDGRG